MPSMDIEIRHIPDCPFTAGLVAELDTILSAEGLDGDIRIRAVATLEQAQRLGFTGSPTILVDGRDPFGHAKGTPALACRLRSEVPSADRLREAIREVLV